jgi:hypothetical protein
MESLRELTPLISVRGLERGGFAKKLPGKRVDTFGAHLES